MKTAQELKIGENAVIADFSTQLLAGRFLQLGIAVGNRIVLVRRAPFSGAYYASISGKEFALRRSELATILVH